MTEVARQQAKAIARILDLDSRDAMEINAASLDPDGMEWNSEQIDHWLREDHGIFVDFNRHDLHMIVGVDLHSVASFNAERSDGSPGSEQHEYDATIDRHERRVYKRLMVTHPIEGASHDQN